MCLCVVVQASRELLTLLLSLTLLYRPKPVTWCLGSTSETRPRFTLIRTDDLVLHVHRRTRAVFGRGVYVSQMTSHEGLLWIKNDNPRGEEIITLNVKDLQRRGVYNPDVRKTETRRRGAAEIVPLAVKRRSIRIPHHPPAIFTREYQRTAAWCVCVFS